LRPLRLDLSRPLRPDSLQLRVRLDLSRQLVHQELPQQQRLCLEMSVLPRLARRELAQAKSAQGTVTIDKQGVMFS
jgi:hypothetical protein